MLRGVFPGPSNWTPVPTRSIPLTGVVSPFASESFMVNPLNEVSIAVNPFDGMTVGGLVFAITETIVGINVS